LTSKKKSTALSEAKIAVANFVANSFGVGQGMIASLNNLRFASTLAQTHV
jgi:hypothetical protein